LKSAKLVNKKRSFSFFTREFFNQHLFIANFRYFQKISCNGFPVLKKTCGLKTSGAICRNIFSEKADGLGNGYSGRTSK